MRPAVIAFAPRYDTPGRHDATGAFQPEASAFCRYNGGRLVLVDNHRSAARMREEVLAALCERERKQSGRPLIAFFCHGQRRRIQFGFGVDSGGRLAELAEACAAFGEGHPGLRIVLYACNAGAGDESLGGDGGFADRLRDALCRLGNVNCQVDAHTTPGHTTRNPFVRRFEGRGSPVGGVGGYYLVDQGSKLWPRWRRALTTDFRFEFPLLTVGQIHERLIAM